MTWKGSLTMVVIDQEPLRRKAASQSRRLMEQLREAEADLEIHETRTVPEFERWKEQCFGPVLTEIRGLEERIHGMDILIAEVEGERLWNGGTYAQAYQRVMRRREAPPADPSEKQNEPPPGWGNGEDEDAGDAFDAFEADFLFEEFIAGAMGIDPDRLDDDVYESLRREFHKFAGGPRPGADADFEPASARSGAKGDPSSRCKELYRILVRRLHPDTGADYGGRAGRLWHDLQEANERGDCERMEMLIAITDLHDGRKQGGTTLFQLRSVVNELRSGLRAIRARLRAAKKSQAWIFAHGQRETLRKRIENELLPLLEELREKVVIYEAQIGQWKKPVSRRRTRQRPKQATHATRSEDSAGQTEFGFA